jgi:hypothetical protein
MAPGPKQHPIQSVRTAIPPETKQPGREANQRAGAKTCLLSSTSHSWSDNLIKCMAFLPEVLGQEQNCRLNYTRVQTQERFAHFPVPPPRPPPKTVRVVEKTNKVKEILYPMFISDRLCGL